MFGGRQAPSASSDMLVVTDSRVGRVQARSLPDCRPTGADGLLAETYLLAPILNILVLHTGQVPSVAGRPFFIVIGFASVISRDVLHFMQ